MVQDNLMESYRQAIAQFNAVKKEVDESGTDDDKNKENGATAGESGDQEDLKTTATGGSHSSNSDSSNDVLDDYMMHVARTGKTLFEWSFIRLLILDRLERAMLEMAVVAPMQDVEQPSYLESKERVLRGAREFQGIPFTIQRICELITAPNKHYLRVDKYYRALEKNICIVSTIGPNEERETEVEYHVPNGTATAADTVTDAGVKMPVHGNADGPRVVASTNDGAPVSLSDIDSMIRAKSSELVAAPVAASTVSFPVSNPPAAVAIATDTNTGEVAPSYGNGTPMPSIEALWNSTMTSSACATIRNNGISPLGPLEISTTITSINSPSDTSLDSLSPSISQSMIGSDEDILSKESYWLTGTTSSLSDLASGGSGGTQNKQFATMTPLQVSQLTSTSDTLLPQASQTTPFSDSVYSSGEECAAVTSSLPSVEIAFSNYASHLSPTSELQMDLEPASSSDDDDQRFAPFTDRPDDDQVSHSSQEIALTPPASSVCNDDYSAVDRTGLTQKGTVVVEESLEKCGLDSDSPTVSD